MNTQLLNEHGDRIPHRPEMSDDIFVATVLKTISSKELSFNIEKDKRTQFIVDFKKAWKPLKDGFLMAMEMFTKGYMVNTNFANDLEKLDSALHNALMHAEIDWSCTYSPIPPIASSI
ncbi:hypothetical protein OTK49_03190 [Vibrio coralliirubri]|uniref:hypothetical protein n=1 Tax=Vibrio coralliirubri TaxID=1516159 RepID=UPI0022844F22|nr:hypothetical protein [Vibrio coralliirubri]MCY9861521.1 hypothetical protein [Vibrio coralliirubri]